MSSPFGGSWFVRSPLSPVGGVHLSRAFRGVALCDSSAALCLPGVSALGRLFLVGGNANV